METVASSGVTIAVNVNMAPPPTTTPPTPTPPPATPTNYNLFGYVKNLVTGLPVQNAIVTSGELAGVTDNNGYFNLGAASAGTHTVEAVQGWMTGSLDVTLPDFGNANSNVLFVLSGFEVPHGGLFPSDFSYTTPDGVLSMFIPQGTRATLGSGNTAAEYVFVGMVEVSADLPPLVIAVVSPGGMGYTLGPDGVVFDEPVTLTIAYDSVLLPAGYNLSHLRIALYDDMTGNWWANYGGDVNETAETVSAPLSHLSTYAVLYTQNPYSMGTVTTTTTTTVTTAAPTATAVPTTVFTTTQESPAAGAALALFAVGAAALLINGRRR